MLKNSQEFSRSDELYDRALEVIPGASQTFSKSAMNLVRGASPLFLERGDGPYVWDVDGNKYLDYILGLLPNILGYRDPNVDTAIKTQLERGITFSLATNLELELADRLVRLIPCAEMVRFGKNGSDATSAAIRLARAQTGRDRVAVCGYHGWHDWYIGTTERSLGVPQSVQDLSSKFQYNDWQSLEALLQAAPEQYAAVILEPESVVPPAPGFLEKVRSLTEEYGLVLVFDEIITGFRVDMGGAQNRYGVTPDLACFGKSMANGMPISAIVGKREIMKLMDDVFVSGTFGGETLSLAAAIATIDKLENTNAVQRLTQIGGELKSAVNLLLDRHDMASFFHVCGPDWRPVVQALSESIPSSIAISLLRQELVANGILMGGAFNLCLAHDQEEIITQTLSAWDQALQDVAPAFSATDPGNFLRGIPIEPVFQVRK
jgi:glutamate-1-semialdehyde 2,1-aminomutase